MLAIQSPVWISILFALIGKASTKTKTEYACSCQSAQLDCTPSLIIVINSSYGLNTKNCGQGAGSCTDCCRYNTDDCLVPYQNLTVLNQRCNFYTSCDIFYEDVSISIESENCTRKKTVYLRVDYECVAGTTPRQTGTPATTSSTIVTSTASLSTSGLTSSSKQSSTSLISTSLNGEDGQSKHLIIILVVVATVLVMSAILLSGLVLHRRGCKKPAKDNASKDDIPNELVNHDFTSNGQSPRHYETVETSNYDEINDKYIPPFSIPSKKEKDDGAILKDEKKNGGTGTIDEYNRIEIEKKCAVKMPNYDSVSAIEVTTLDDTYSHVPSQSKPASVPTTNEYSHNQFARKDTQSNEHSNKKTLTNVPRVADNYSHVDLDSDRTKRKPLTIEEHDSYNHIDIDNTINASRNEEAISMRTMHTSDEGPQTFKEDLKSIDVENNESRICDRDYGLSSQNASLQDIKAVSLSDNYIPFKIGDIYDSPRYKDQQYDVVLHDNNEQLLNRIDTRSKRKSAAEGNNDGSGTEDYAIKSDYELAKQINI